MVNSRLLVFCGLLIWFVFGGEAISTLSITGTKFYDTNGQQVFFKGSTRTPELRLTRVRSCVSAVTTGSIDEYHAMSTRCSINANARCKCHPKYLPHNLAELIFSVPC